MSVAPTTPPLLPRWLLRLSLSLILVGVVSRMTVIGLSRYLNQSAENSAISGILDVSEGKNIFPDKSVIPFRLYTYTPLQAWLVGTVLSPLKNSSTMTRVYWIRFSSLLFIISLIFIFWKAYVKGSPITSSFFILSLALCSPEFGNYALSGRNDFLALLMEIIAGAFFIQWLKTKKLSSLNFYAIACVLAFLTRQNSAGMLLSGGLYLLLNRNLKELLIIISVYTTCVISILIGVTHFYPHFWMHSFKAHVGVWRMFYWLHPSTLLFFACHSLFLFLGIRNCFRKDSSSQIVFLKLAVVVTASISFVLIHRHGAWLNYFFETLLLLSLFTSRELARTAELPKDSRSRNLISLLIPIFSALIFSVTVSKAIKQYSSLAFLEFTEAADSVRTLAPQGGVSLGAWAQGLGVHLRDWEIIGPEILNGSHYGEANYAHFKWVYEKLANISQSSTAPALLYVNPDCGGVKEAAPLITDPYLLQIMGNYQLKNVIYPWLCLYEAPPKR